MCQETERDTCGGVEAWRRGLEWETACAHVLSYISSDVLQLILFLFLYYCTIGILYFVFECVVHCRYLPVRVDPATGRMTYSHSIRLTGVPARKISDSSFWFLLFRPLVYRSQKQDGPTFLYVNIRRAVFGVPGR